MKEQILTLKEKIQSRIVIWLTVIADFVIVGVAYGLLPDMIPDIWTLDGTISNMTDKNILMFILPITALLSEVAFEILPYIDPSKHNYRRFERAFNMMRIFVAVVLTVLSLMYVLKIRYCESAAVHIVFKAIIAAGIILIGNLLPKLKRNYFVGITNPWSVASSRVWFLTHRFAGRYYIVTGLIMLIVSVFNNIAANTIYVCLIVTLFIVPTIYSFNRYYVRTTRRKTENKEGN